MAAASGAGAALLSCFAASFSAFAISEVIRSTGLAEPVALSQIQNRPDFSPVSGSACALLNVMVREGFSFAVTLVNMRLLPARGWFLSATAISQ